MYEYVTNAYVVLVKAGVYILDETDRANESQKLVPESYKLAVANKIVSEQ